MKLSRRDWLVASGALLASPLTQAQGDKSVLHILVGLPPGGGTDSIARYFADKLSIELGRPSSSTADRVPVVGLLPTC